jgi:prepilin-type processing-associated H-X9-DG protein
MWSENPSGCNMLLGDGSVTFVSATVDPLTWAALSTHRSGDMVGDY